MAKADKLTLEQFGQQVKSKHPEYSDIPDAELAQKVIAKYPQYNDMVDASTAPAAHDIHAVPRLFSKVGLKELGYNLADKVTKALPGTGGLIGGVLGAGGGTVLEPGGGSVAGAIGGAGLGGGLGTAAQHAIRSVVFPQAPQMSLPETMNDITKGGIEQAAYEAMGQGIGRMGKALSPKLAEAAIAPGKRLLKSIPEDVNIGETVLRDTKGYRPGTIAKELDAKISEETAKKGAALSGAKESGTKISLRSPRGLVDSEAAKALQENSPDYIRSVGDVRDQLRYEYGADGKPIKVPAGSPSKPGAGFVPVQIGANPKMVEKSLPTDIDPERFDAVRRGVDKTINSFNPETQNAVAPLQMNIRGTMARQLHDAVPDTIAPDANMTRFIPTKEAAWNTSFNPGITRNIFEKLQRPTGALVGGIAGFNEGQKEGGTLGGLAGGALGLAGGNFLASPTGMIGAARLLDRAPQVVRYLRPLVPAIESEVEDQPKSDKPKK